MSSGKGRERALLEWEEPKEAALARRRHRFCNQCQQMVRGLLGRAGVLGGAIAVLFLGLAFLITPTWPMHLNSGKQMAVADWLFLALWSALTGWLIVRLYHARTHVRIFAGHLETKSWGDHQRKIRAGDLHAFRIDQTLFGEALFVRFTVRQGRQSREMQRHLLLPPEIDSEVVLTLMKALVPGRASSPDSEDYDPDL